MTQMLDQTNDPKAQLTAAIGALRGGRFSVEDEAYMIAFGLFRMRMLYHISKETRFALGELSLRLVDEHRQPVPAWIPKLREELSAAHKSGLEPDWGEASGRTGADTIRLVNLIRAGLGRSEYVSPKDSGIIEPTTGPELPIGVRSGTKIQAISLRNFRACTDLQRVELRNGAGSISSLIVFGDNGVGKSSIASAVEFACQGTVGRKRFGAAIGTAELVNLTHPESEAWVQAELADGRLLERSASKDRYRWTIAGGPDPFEFSLVPMSLQRADIVTFLNTPSKTRAQLFVDQMDPGIEDEDDPGLIAERRLELLKQTRREIMQDLCLRANVPLGTDFNMHGRLLREVHLDGQTGAEWLASGREIPIAMSEERAAWTKLQRELAEAKKAVSLLPRTTLRNHAHRVRRFSEILGDLSVPLTDAVKSITGYAHLDRLSVDFGFNGPLSLELRVHLSSGTIVAPEGLFSEGVQDLIAILFFLEVARAASERGQARILILDDVIQSVDSTVRTRLLEHICDTFRDWQLIITCHDRLWREQVRTTFSRRGVTFVEAEVRSWSFEKGPAVVQQDAANPAGALRESLSIGEPTLVSASAGRLLEKICDRLSWTLPVSVTRRRGDRYDLGSLWPPVRARLQKGNLAELTTRLDSLVLMRNLLGAHYNEDAESFSMLDVTNFAQAVLELWESTYCESCVRWVAPAQGATLLTCRCGKAQIELKSTSA
ncbi:hypothetical protein OO014_12400 [Intrasporangium calvum]|uniref:Rad50/SbcC-type AAA domain-containing protein n=1 Tax=Intrasporangium calvum TaxID=53358 RepID=A0ABT5GIM0_9MICO|nr:hypothetical protein [Intrasporangium calvum]MDC5698061.1 hypothetical protein [Intrasporangium calvum]